MPRFLKHPLIFQLSPTDRVTIYRSPKDTCGLYTWGVFTVSNGGSPVPPIHDADKEWFLASMGQVGPWAPPCFQAMPRCFQGGESCATTPMNPANA